MGNGNGFVIPWKVIIWAVPIIFTAGGTFVSVRALAQDQDKIEARVVVVERDLNDHTKGSGHTVTDKRLDHLEEQNRRMLEALQKITDKVNLASENIRALCEKQNVNCR